MVQCTQSDTQQRLQRNTYSTEFAIVFSFSPDKASSQDNRQCLHTQRGSMVPMLKILQPMQTAQTPWKKKKLLRSSQGEQNAMKDASHDYFQHSFEVKIDLFVPLVPSYYLCMETSIWSSASRCCSLCLLTDPVGG